MMASQDITFCANFECEIDYCIRNPKNIRQPWLDHSFAYLEDTEDCWKNKEVANENN